MILADKIIEERKKNGWSQEELADKLGVSRQAVSKWEGAGSVPDLQRVIQMSELFGVSTDYLLREDLLPEDSSYISTATETSEPIRRVSMEEANDFLEMKRRGAPIIANAVALCILSPVLLVILETMAEESMFNITKKLADSVGVVSLLVMIAFAVFLFITEGIRGSRMEYLEEENFETEYGVTGMVKERSRSYEPVFTRGIAIGVVLCILSSVPIVIAGAMEAPEYIIGLLVGLLLLLIAVGVNMMIRVSIIKGSYNALLQEGDFSKSLKLSKGKLNILYGVYWALATAIYFILSFGMMRWEISWVVWPVAGVLFIAVSGIAKMVFGAEETNR